uniref:Uncharacterized protein n=1 Tax=Oryza punctata TaxID=4537 RepID=A0A0E0LLU7_ORYPU
MLPPIAVSKTNVASVTGRSTTMSSGVTSGRLKTTYLSTLPYGPPPIATGHNIGHIKRRPPQPLRLVARSVDPTSWW